MEHVYDAGEEVRRNEEWEPLFGPFQEVSDWLGELQPDRLVVIYNDHMDEFFLLRPVPGNKQSHSVWCV